jgi:uncharacterized RDD family membrane protein YckC
VYQTAQPPWQVPAAPDGRALAGAGHRLGARVIDALLVLVAMLVVAGIVVGGGAALLSSLSDGGPPFPPVVAVIGIIVIVLALQYVYEVEVPLRWNGQTPGKRLLKIAIAPLQPQAPLRRGQLAYRFAILMVFNLLANCYIGLIDPLWCLWDKPYKQCLHDKPPKTVVVNVNPTAQR